MTIAICDCMCDRCVIHDDCTTCTYIADEPAFREVHPVTNAEDEAALAAARPRLTDEERDALALVMSWRYDNVIETRQQTGDDEYNTVDENECSALVTMLNDFDYDPAAVASVDHLFDAIWIVLDDEHAYDDDEDLDIATLRSAATKIGYPCPDCTANIMHTHERTRP